MRLRHEEWMCPLKSRFKVNKKLQFDYAAVFVYSCLWMLLRNNTKSHCSTCGIPLSLSLSHPLLSLLARPWSMRKQGTRGIHGFIVFHHYYWQAQITWMMGNPHTKLTRPCVFTLPKSCCSLAWNRRRRRGGEAGPHILTSVEHLSRAVHARRARAHSNTYLPPFYSPALKNTMTINLCWAFFPVSTESTCFIHLDDVTLLIFFIKLTVFMSTQYTGPGSG